MVDYIESNCSLLPDVSKNLSKSMPQDQKKRYHFRFWSLLFPLIVSAQRIKGNTSQVPQNGFEVFTAGDADEKAPYFQRSRSNNDTYWAHNPPAMVLWTYVPHYDPNNDTVNLGGSMARLGEIISPASQVIRWISPIESLTECMGQSNSGGDICIPVFYCLRSTELGLSSDNTSQDHQFSQCLEQRFNIVQDEDEPSWQCLMSFGPPRNVHESDSCLDQIYDLTAENWRNLSSANTAWDLDTNLQIALAGGVDGEGMYWEGRRSSETLAETIGRQFWGQPGVTCSIDFPCQAPTNCSKVGSFTAIGMGKSNQPAKLAWVFLVSSAFTNINQQLVNQYNELKNALGNLALDGFTIDDFQETSSQSISLGGLTGLTGVFTILGGFIPTGGPATEATGTIASGAATFLSSSISSGDLSEATKSFSETVSSYCAELRSGLEDLIAKLFAGDQIPGPGPGSFNITDMMKNGTWVDPKVLTGVSDMPGKIRTEILARSVDSLWKVPTSNKVWVIFNDLQDDTNHTKCETGASILSLKDGRPIAVEMVKRRRVGLSEQMCLLLRLFRWTTRAHFLISSGIVFRLLTSFFHVQMIWAHKTPNIVLTGECITPTTLSSTQVEEAALGGLKEPISSKVK